MEILEFAIEFEDVIWPRFMGRIQKMMWFGPTLGNLLPICGWFYIRGKNENSAQTEKKPMVPIVGLPNHRSLWFSLQG